MSNTKTLVPITDKNGKQTRVWKNADGSTSQRSQAIGAPSVAVTSGNLVVPETVTVHDFRNEPHTLKTDKWSNEAEETFARGQCAAFAYALATGPYEGTTIKAATNRSGTTLIHVWLEDGGMMIDAEGAYYYQEEDYVDELYYQWGEPDITEHTPESLKAWIESENPNAKQDWEAAEMMIPAWDAEYNK